MDLLLQLPVLFFSVILHEFAHGFTAYKMGDDTAYLSGRLTFNPIAHIDLFGTLVLPIICYMSGMPMIGWAKPVPVNPYRFRNPRRDIMKVSAAGPLSNISFAIFCAILFKLTLVSSVMLSQGIMLGLVKIFQFAIIINLVLAFFNLIPIAPLDGSKVLLGLLPSRYAEKYERHFPYGMWIIIGLLVTGFMKWLILPPLFFSLKILASVGLGAF